MNLEKLTNLIPRIFFFCSFSLLVLAGLEFVVNLFGYTVLRARSYTAGRLLEFSTIFFLVVVVFLLRQVRDALKKTKI